jgi:FkbM family methyltransferase
MADVRRVLRRNRRLFAAAQRAYVLARYAARRPHESDFAAFADLPGDNLFVDVGANSGASALSFRLYKPNKILSIEPSLLHVAHLRTVARLVGNMSVMCCAAGREHGVAALHVPYDRGTPLSQYASLDRREVARDSWNVRHALGDDASDRFEVRVEHTPIVRLDDLHLTPSFVKVDAQGHERAVIEGLEATISRHRPVLLVELGGDWDLIDHMAGLAYHPYVFNGTMQPFRGSVPTGNLFFLPRPGANRARASS